MPKKEVKVRIFKPRLAKLVREMCEQLYQKGASHVYEYANKVGLLYHDCVPCEASTPTISDSKSHTCALCGTNKSIILNTEKK